MTDMIAPLTAHTPPKHIAIIMDGNGRWAKQRMLPRIAGHHRGVEAVRRVVHYCVERKISILTLFAFSCENWQRPAYEVQALMALLNKVLSDEVKEIHANNICLQVIGNTNVLALPMRQAITKAQNLTKNNSGLQLNIAINYSGKWDITQAMQRIALDIQHKKITEQQIKEKYINEDLIASYLSLAECNEPDLLIRTSGEQRISNFMLWQLAYTELYFTPILWPDFDEQAMDDALIWYGLRQRRFGTVFQELGTLTNA